MGPPVDENKLQFAEKNIIRYKLTASGKVNHSILNYRFMRPVSNLRLPKEQEQAKTAISRKKLSEKSVEDFKKRTFH